MRKPVPALILATTFALASGSALALGDRNKEKKAADGATTSSQSSANPSSSGAAAPSAPSTASPSAAGSAAATTSGSMSASTNGAGAIAKDKKNDPRCDESKVTRANMPKDCFAKTAAASGSASQDGTPGQSGGASASGTGSSGAGAGSSSSSSSGK